MRHNSRDKLALLLFVVLMLADVVWPLMFYVRKRNKRNKEEFPKA